MNKFLFAVVMFFVVLGALNFCTLNDAIFKDVIKVCTDKPVKEIPKETLKKVSKYNWRFLH